MSWKGLGGDDMRSFKKCVISVAINGSEDDGMNIENLENYEVGESEEEAIDDECEHFWRCRGQRRTVNYSIYTRAYYTCILYSVLCRNNLTYLFGAQQASYIG